MKFYPKIEASVEDQNQWPVLAAVKLLARN
jgi:hypothetical protein